MANEPNPKKAGMNGYDKAGYSKAVMVNPADVEKSMLEVALQVARDFPHQRRPDGRKSPDMLCAEEALRLRTEARAREQELETLRLQRDIAVSKANDALDENKVLRGQLISGFYEQRVPAYRQGEPRHELEELVTANEVQYLANRLQQLRDNADRVRVSRWFRFGRWMGFYR